MDRQGKSLGKLKVVIGALFLLVIVVLTGVIILSIVSAKDDKNIFGYSGYTVMTGSMTGKNKDSFGAGSFIISKKIKPEEVKVGDIIEFTLPADANVKYAHRVIKIENNIDGLKFYTKGDNNSSADSYPVSVGYLKGKTVFSIPFLGLLLYQMRDMYFTVSSVIFIVLIINMPLIFNVKRKKALQ